MTVRIACVLLTLIAGMLAVPDPTLAYGGPGSVISGIGALIAVLAAVVVSIFGFVWFPAKRLMRRIRGGDGESAEENPSDAPVDLARE